MNKIRFMSIIAAIMIASVGMAGCKERPAPASSDDGEAVVTTTTTELVVPIPTTTTVTEPTTTTTVTTTTTKVTTTTEKVKATTTTKKPKVTTTTKATKKAKVTTTTKATKKKDGGGNLSVGGGTKPKGNTNLKTPDGQPVKKEGGKYYQWAPDLNMWLPYDPDLVVEKGGVEVGVVGDGKGGLSGEKVGH